MRIGITTQELFSTGVSLKLLAKHQLAEQVANLSYEYCETSSFSLAASSPRCGGKVQLKDHYRCHQDIALYFNEQFYSKTLRVITNRSNLKVPSGYHAGIQWSNIVGQTEKVGGTGAICRAEIDAVSDAIVQFTHKNPFHSRFPIGLRLFRFPTLGKLTSDFRPLTSGFSNPWKKLVSTAGSQDGRCGATRNRRIKSSSPEGCAKHQ